MPSFGDYFAESMNSVGLSTPSAMGESAGTIIGHVGTILGAMRTVRSLGNPSLQQLLREVTVRSPATFAWIGRMWPNLANRLAAMRVAPALSGAGSVGAVEIAGFAAAAYAAYYCGALLGALAYATMMTNGLDLSKNQAVTGIFNWWYDVDKLEAQNKEMERKLAIMRNIKKQAQEAHVTIPPGQLSRLASLQMGQ